MGKTSWNGQIYRALKAIDHIGESKYAAKQAQGWKPGEAVEGIYSFGTFTTVFKRAITYKNWLIEEYPGLRFFEEIDYEMTTEYLNEKSETCQTDTVQTIVATLGKSFFRERSMLQSCMGTCMLTRLSAWAPGAAAQFHPGKNSSLLQCPQRGAGDEIQFAQIGEQAGI